MVPERAKQSCELSTPSRLLLRSEKAGKKKTFSCSERELPRRDALAIRVRLIIGLSSGPVRLTVPLAQTVFGAPKASRAKRTLRGRGYWPLEVIGSASGQRAEARCPESEDAQKLSVRRKERVKTNSRFMLSLRVGWRMKAFAVVLAALAALAVAEWTPVPLASLRLFCLPRHLTAMGSRCCI